LTAKEIFWADQLFAENPIVSNVSAPIFEWNQQEFSDTYYPVNGTGPI
jgi:hypothetical protein